ncbi:NAD(P)H-binding protein [Parendozoicomonas haliclonae]|uniref:NAD(P)-binding domain-containing protein n=1 Tax=Parendozoicomonas haliclonae TaxID=1960125 RepID=A0A1X7AI26_9GAMM|nr:NAD(P)H-binding protein [Parendozoicomonas haliclonae]SMA42775.1 hypothetical protein EHSB41UT_01486 [Parendozoicomonas haliclonae]
MSIRENRTERRCAIVAGSSGAVGRHVLDRLLQAPEYERVISLVRRPSGIADPKLDERIVDFDNLDLGTLPEPQATDVFCCLGTTRKKAGSAEAFRKVDFDYVLNLGLLAKDAQVERFAVISSIGAGSGKNKGLYLRTKAEMEQALKALQLPSLIIVRPSLLVGERNEFRLGEHLAQLPLKLLSFIPGFGNYRPIRTAQVASAMVTLALGSGEGVHIYESRALQNDSERLPLER